ncbi:MAG: TonB-dependent receptor [Steroidobacteraceae bacterium]
MSSLRKCAVSTASFMAFAATAPVHAQTAGNEVTLDEVVVTAQKREVNLQAVAQTVTAVSGEALVRQGVKDITDLARVAPEVNVIAGSMNNITIRGIRTNSFGPTLDNANAVYVDGNYNARFTSLNGLFFDVQRIEVLDGPQGTLYGRNSAGGAINVITNRPGSEFGGTGTVEIGNYNAVMLTGAVNLPLTDTLSSRFSYYRTKRSGFYTDTGLNDQNIESWRAQLQWKPGENDTLLISAYASTLGGKGSGATTLKEVLKNPTILTNTTTGNIVAYNGACPAGATCTSAVVPIRASDDPWHNATLYGNADLTFAGVKSDAFALQYDHVFQEFATLTFQASRMTNKADNGGGTANGLQQDRRLTAAQLLFNTAYGSPAAVDDTWDSQELRLTSIATRPLQWVVGLYRFHEKGGGSNATYARSVVTDVNSPNLGSFIFPATRSIAQDIPNILNETTALAAFGQATWTPAALDRLHLTAGLRYNKDDKHGVLYIYPQNGPISVGAFGPTGLFDQSKSWTSTTYKANISWDLTEQNMIYIDRATGFQSGGYGYGASPAYEPTKISAWEIGSKNRFFDNRLQVNFSAWDYKYTGQTQNINDVFLVNFAGLPCPGSPGCIPFNFITVANAGSTKVRGQSLDIQVQPTANDHLSLNVQHIDGKFEDYDLTARYTANAIRFGTTFAALNPGYSPTGDQSGPSFNFNGTQVGATPKIGIRAGYDHTFRGGDFEYTPALYYVYNGKQRNGNGVAPNMPPGEDFWTLPAWSTIDLSFAIARADGRYSLTFWGRNLANKLTVTGRGYSANSAALSPAAALYAYTTESYGPPRTYGLTVNANF